MKIPSRAKKCCVDQTPLQPGYRYLSVLNEEGSRFDYCEPCGQQISPTGNHWWATIPESKKEVVSPDEQLLEKLRMLSEHNSSLAYLLALYLERQGMICRRSKHLFEVPHTGEVFKLKLEKISEADEKKMTELLSIDA